ncbi:MAG: reverse transcriptase family protein [Pseudomonadota bacterium]|nr:reverse transcriptase family protein [Pseudomonadota bacterium]
MPPFSPKYDRTPIRQVASLAKALNIDVGLLHDIARKSNGMYREVKEEKNGKIRITYDASSSLKGLHKRLKRHVLEHVIFPSYLNGSIKGRDYKLNAQAHAGAKIVICEDISGFFPSINANKVYDVWRYFFKFGEDVSVLLTELTTLNGFLPQGAITSPYLANLVFWRDEFELVTYFSNLGLIYTRFVDDMAVSSKTFIEPETKTVIISKIIQMMRKNGCKINRKKHELLTAGKRMAVTKLTINQGVHLSKLEQRRIRAAVEQIVIQSNMVEILEVQEFLKLYLSVAGRVNHMSRFEPEKAKPLKVKLDMIKKKHIALLGSNKEKQKSAVHKPQSTCRDSI